MIELQFDDKSTEQFDSAKKAIARVAELTLEGQLLVDLPKGRHLVGMNDAAAAMYAGNMIQGASSKVARADAEEFADSGLTSLEFEYKKGRIADAQLGGNLSKIKSNINKVKK